MKLVKKYLPFAVGIFILGGAFYPFHISYEWIGLVILFLIIILLFELIEETRVKRIKRWNLSVPGLLSHSLKFILFFGLPVVVIIIYLIHNKAQLIYSILFILVPLILIFGWIGYLDWQYCNKLYLQEKYKINAR